jgi:K+-transporting ATPase ATPase C chain
MDAIWSILRIFTWMTLLTGLIYPLVITGIAQLFMSKEASGEIVFVGDKAVGAKLIAQKFDSEKYFWPRPSAIDYNPLPSGGSNLGPTSATLKKAVAERRAKILQLHQGAEEHIPRSLLFASGSGLDPHISVKAAYFQMKRVAAARGMQVEQIKQLIDEQIVGRQFGFLGNPYVNVLMLNIALDKAMK